MSEFNPAAEALSARPRSLAGLLNSSSESERLWRPEELAAIFRHQLSAPVLLDLGGFDATLALRLRNLSEAQGLLLKSFSELFRHPDPPLELLVLTKDFAKANMNQPESTLPGEVATALYYASIASALVRLGARISTLKDPDLHRGFGWTMEQGWIDEGTRGLLADARAALTSGAGKPHPKP
jgi:hypothetical protein